MTIRANFLIAGITLMLCFAVSTNAEDNQDEPRLVFNMAYCLETEASGARVGFLINKCMQNLKVTFCYGTIRCENPLGTGATDVPALGKRTARYWSENPNLIAFAAPEDTDFLDYMYSVEHFFKNRNPDGPDID